MAKVIEMYFLYPYFNWVVSNQTAIDKSANDKLKKNEEKKIGTNQHINSYLNNIIWSHFIQRTCNTPVDLAEIINLYRDLIQL